MGTEHNIYPNQMMPSPCGNASGMVRVRKGVARYARQVANDLNMGLFDGLNYVSLGALIDMMLELWVNRRPDQFTNEEVVAFIRENYRKGRGPSTRRAGGRFMRESTVDSVDDERGRHPD